MNDLEQKLALLREEYRVALPKKIAEITALWQALKQTPSVDNLTIFHRKIHSLHGSASTYGYLELGKTASKLENLINPIINKPNEILNETASIEELLGQINAVALNNDGLNMSPEQKNEATKAVSKTIYLLDSDKELENNLLQQMTIFGYKIECFEDEKLFVDALTKQLPAILIINIELVNDYLENKLKEKIDDAMPPIIFTSTSVNFNLRLKTVRLGGEAFLIKPFLIEDLITQIDHLLKSDNQAYRILIIDDEIEVASYNSALIEQAGMKTCIITKANETDKALHEFNPDLILIDINMPDCNGIELAKIIRQQNLFQSTPIIYLSAEVDPVKKINAMKLGADDFVTKSTSPTALIATIKNRVERYQKLRSLQVQDNLTGLYNHSFIQSQLGIELKESMLLHNPLSIAIIDLDKCKAINETYGHQAGDHVLKSLGLMIRKRLRVNNLVGRFGGEKFLVILPNTALEAAKTITDDLRKQFLTLNYSWNQQIFNASFSAGVASFPQFHTVTELIEAATRSIEKSKKLGRNRVEAAV